MVELVSGDGDNIKIGQRVMVADGQRGTICYVGLVPPNEGTWIGIDWDDPSRGKHDGVYKGVRYFTSRHPTSGSFVRKEKIDVGRSCVEAIKLRYGDNVVADDLEDTLLQVKKALNAPFLEMVGFDAVNKKLSCFETLEIVWLHDYAVSSVGGDPNELKELCPNIREMDLSKNLLSDWFEVAGITKQLNSLTILNLSENILRAPADNEVNEINKLDAFMSLKYIVLSSMNYSWSDILQCAQLWPNILHIQVPFNIIKSLDSPNKSVLQNLRSLDLESNNIQDWEEVNKLGTLPLLETINLINTGISKIRIPDAGLFKSLKHLLLSQNNISSWLDISELDKLKLEEFRFRDNPVLIGCTKATSRQLIIARISSLKFLNGQEITREERRGSEYDYIKKHGQQWYDSKTNDELYTAFIKEHPRYMNLIKKYGEAESSEYTQVSTKLKSSLIRVELFGEPTGQIITKSLPRSMLVQRLAGLVQKLFNISSVVPELSVLSRKNPDLKICMNNHLKTLDFYSVEDGDRLIIKW
ncbi:tubulin-binding cofactor E isoform X2 [Lycorma delicatula]